MAPAAAGDSRRERAGRSESVREARPGEQRGDARSRIRERALEMDSHHE